jgi:hypothetical protein
MLATMESTITSTDVLYSGVKIIGGKLADIKKVLRL